MREKEKVVYICIRNSFTIEIDARRYHRSRVHLRGVIGKLDKTECSVDLNEIIPFSNNEADEPTSR